MKKVLSNVGKNIGVILLSIVVLAIGQIVQGLAYKIFSQYYLQLIISSTIRIVTTVVLAWLVSSKLLKMDAQTAFERTHTHAEWMKIFGKNYL